MLQQGTCLRTAVPWLRQGVVLQVRQGFALLDTLPTRDTLPVSGGVI